MIYFKQFYKWWKILHFLKKDKKNNNPRFNWIKTAFCIASPLRPNISNEECVFMVVI